MAVFEYTALNAQGRKTKGVVDAESVRAARQKLKTQGIFPTVIEETRAKQRARAELKHILSDGKVSTAQVSIATRQLATLVGAGIPLVEALRAVGDQLDHARLKAVFAEICDRVNEGATLADAVRQYPRVFPRLYPNMIASGEASGTLELVLARLADLLESQVSLRRKVIAAISYPVLMLILCFLVIAVLLAFVVPQLTAIFEEHGAALPLPTQIVVGLSNFVLNYGVFLLVAVIIGVVAFVRYARTKAGRARLDAFALRLPLISGMTTQISTASFARTLGTMLSSGVEVLTALSIVKNVVGNAVFEDAVEQVMEGVREGKGVAVELDRTKVFPSLLIHMVAIGERSGQLESMLVRAADTYEQEVNTLVSGLTAVLNPILILFLAGVVGIILLSVMLPMLEMTSLIG